MPTPKAPTVPDAPVKEPGVIPEKQPRPSRRDVPMPAPVEPGRKIPARPVVDPKALQPEMLYSNDDRIAPFWNELPMGLKRLMIENVRREQGELEEFIRAREGSSDPQTLVRVVKALETEIESLEADRKKELLEVIRRMMISHYGKEWVDPLAISIGTTFPTPQQPEATDGRMVPELPERLAAGMIHRTELRNLWLQGEGWLGMEEFIFLYAHELDAIVPGIAEKYQVLHKIYRLGQLAQLGLIPGLTPEVMNAIERARGAITAGFEIVTSDFKVVNNEEETPFIRLKEVKGVAVGRNAWAAAHEARKAGSQMATPMEGAYRWLMSEEQRGQLDEATNSAIAEIRQGVFGPCVVKVVRKRLELLFGKSDDQAKHYELMDLFFSMPPDAFREITTLLFNSEFETNRAVQQEARSLLETHGIR